MKGVLVAVPLLFCAAWAQADTIYKCVDAQGKVTFTKQACPNGGNAGVELNVENRRPSGSGEGAVMAQPALQAPPADYAPAGAYPAQPPANPAPVGGTRVTVVGGSEERPGCSTGLSERDLRTAMVRKEIVPGMSRKEIEDMFGTPSDQASAHGAGSSTYWNDKYLNFFSINYDANGCVVNTYQSGSSN
ncbi:MULTISPECIES: DUF4124 domain-containing protein [unclassified Pseudomonas]|uniref:DUF4124 domain-containing protein n=1 Tax=unclassified Pseudomonas TaxID=196821 RepID=UPI000D6F51A8|nr:MULTISPECIES: DUF4124 domain-containing protein [unclassified Pseudomonas]MED5611319.1 DUF4124 domain-containing protein [Pseudomonas sp. JH-2]PWU28417.1 hypothetical protein DK254_21545 [Pseudomonas sp. RW407]